MESGGAVSVTTGVAGPLIAKLAALMGDEIQEDVRQDMLLVKDELRSIKAFVLNLAEGRLEEKLELKMWRRHFREMTFRMDSSIDLILAGGFALKSAGARCLHVLGLPAVQDPGYQMSILVREFKGMIAEVNALLQRYDVPGFAASVAVPAIDCRLLKVLYGSEDELVGIHTQRQELITRLIHGGGHLKVISIVGIAGLGKTTLANMVYCAIGEQFDCSAFVSLSPDPDMRKILRSLLERVGATDIYCPSSEWDVSRLVYTLREFLSAKRYLVVIDDIWSTLAWRTIRSAFPENSLGSRILTTTQIMSVAMSCCHPNNNLVYEMKPLTGDDARRLFLRRIFGDEDSCPSELKQLSADILKKCGGLPLGIMSISALLVNVQASIEGWRHMRDSIELGREGTFLVPEMTSLYLSYSELPLQLRTCLLYLTMFPENFIIGRDRLIKRWMAEGFIVAKRGQSLQEAGEWYFSELINRSIIQPVGTQSKNQADACRVHSIIFSFLAHISTEENFVTLYARYHEYICRRLFIDNRDRQGYTLRARCVTHEVRSLSVFGSVLGVPRLSKFGVLRVLDMEIDGELESHYLDDISHLFHLKYFRLQTTSIVQLAKIEKLQYLETLDLTRTPISVLPESILLLKRLKHLLVNNVKLPAGIQKMQCLTELSRVKVDSTNSTDSLKELGSLTKLRVLGLHWCISDTDDQVETYVDNLVSSLNSLSKCNLQSLYIASNDGCTMDFLLDAWSPPPSLQEFQMDTKYCLPRIPEWMASHLNLAFLDINVDSVEQHVLQTLGALPALLVLLLASKKSPPQELGLRLGSDEFYFLQRFNFTCWNSWAVLMFEPGAMPQLKKLELVFCAKGGSAYDGSEFGIEHLSFLKYLCVKINVKDASGSEVEAAEAAIQRAANNHPYHPITEVTRWNEEEGVTPGC